VAKLVCLRTVRTARSWPPQLFSLLILPPGIVVGFKSTARPFLLAKAGVSVDRIASISSVVNLPGALVFLWAPLVDTRLRRRTWLMLAIFATALSVCIYFPLIGASHLKLMTALILAGGVADSLILAACGGLMVRTLSPDAQAKASAWWQAGFLGGGALGGAESSGWRRVCRSRSSEFASLRWLPFLVSCRSGSRNLSPDRQYGSGDGLRPSAGRFGTCYGRPRAGGARRFWFRR